MDDFKVLNNSKMIGDMLSSIAEYVSTLFLERLLHSESVEYYTRSLKGLEGGMGLYIHIPYCHKPLCAFCCFVRYPAEDRGEVRAYHRLLRREAELLASLAEGVRITTIYVGGGTPSIDVDELAETIDWVRSVFGAKSASVSVEVHPRDVDEHLVEVLRGRVDRVSVGLQALEAERLARMGRLNTSLERSIEAVEVLRGRFRTVNVDLVWGIPGDNAEIVGLEARRAFNLGVDQVTFYPVMPTPRTRNALKKGRASVWNPEEPRLYKIILEEAEAAGYKPCTPWCMCRGARELIDEYIVETPWFLALGVSGISRIPGCVAANTFSVKKYFRLVEGGGLSVENATRVTCVEEALYTMLSSLFGLEYLEGMLVKLHGPCAAPVERLAKLLLRALGESIEGGVWRVSRPGTLYTLHRLQHALYTALAAFRYVKLSYASRPHPPR